ncbi:hypothetical protein G6F22_020788 [Rhizopus arrhizus]|nr:hypothetical protein G6F22_020788 [Rhizopus arrhizus]
MKNSATPFLPSAKRSARSAYDPDDAAYRQHNPGHHPCVGPLAVDDHRQHHRQARPEIVDDAKLDGLPAVKRETQGQRQADLVGNEQQTADDEIAPGKTA